MSEAAVIVDIEIDPSKIDVYKKYIELITPHVHAAGGVYLVRGGAPETLDGDWVSSRIVVMEFPDRKTAINWLNDKNIQHIHDMRRNNALKCNMIVCDMQ